MAKPTDTAKEAKDAPPAKDAGASAEKNAPEGSPSAKPAGLSFTALIPLVAVIVIAPVLSWAVAQFVLMPQLKKQLAAAPDAHAAPLATAPEGGGHGESKEGGHGKKGEPSNATTYEFENVVVNLAGTMGTRYLKTSFLVTGSDPILRPAFDSAKPKMVDITLNVLSALSLTDLEEAGAKNIIREKLIGAYNQAFGKKVVEQIYFSDFVVQ